jgi:PEP-CTERM motif
LTFAGAPSTNYTAPTLVDLGQFVTAFSPSGGTSGFTAFTGVTFTLTINQTSPSGGSAVLFDGITGSLAYNPSNSTLVWTPTTTTTSIGAVTYKLVTDNTGNLNIQAPTTGDGANPNPTSVKANVSVTPEPATFLLLAPGLAGLGVAARFRRRSLKK